MECSSTGQDSSRKRSCLRRSYDWTLSWAEHPQAGWALFAVAVIEASVFPIPPDVLLIALALARPELALRFASICTAGSTVGSAIGYGIGMFLLTAIAMPVLEFYHAVEKFEYVQSLFAEWGIGLVLIAGFSPVPFKVITIAAGAFGLPFIGFIAACIASRAARFYLEGALLRWGGEYLRLWVEKYFEWVTVVVVVLVIAGFALLWLW
jgi:membrane protein YqaA with SNARE-associated domain